SDHSGVRHCFLLDNGFLAHVQSMNGGAIYDLVIEYSENEDQMRVYDTEDGELFPVNDPSVFETVDDLVDAMLDEMKRTGESN
ncbi:MAG: hypothetical protein J6U26_06145, partial [Lachnospiraceae bacterium]|nr:hypothetical protein [Lachnospiraceae bacterium]